MAMKMFESIRHGLFNFLRKDGSLVQLRMPWCKPLFSERTGIRLARWKSLGFRIHVLPPRDEMQLLESIYENFTPTVEALYTSLDEAERTYGFDISGAPANSIACISKDGITFVIMDRITGLWLRRSSQSF